MIILSYLAEVLLKLIGLPVALAVLVIKFLFTILCSIISVFIPQKYLSN